MDAADKVKSIADMAAVLDGWDIIDIEQFRVHCREKFFVDNFEPESIEDTGRYVTATAHAHGVAFFALFDIGRGDLKEGYRLAAEKFKTREGGKE